MDRVDLRNVVKRCINEAAIAMAERRIKLSSDLDECYVDYPTMVKAAGLNGYNTAEEVLPIPPAPFPVDNSIEVEVTVDGKQYGGKLNRV